MRPPERTRVRVSPGAPALLAVFVWLSSPEVLGAVLLAALCHELGHYAVLRSRGGWVRHMEISALGANMQVAGRLSYGSELLTAAGGPAVNLLLAAGKFIVGVLSGALSVQADAVNNLSDAGSQIISLVSFRIAARPADREHPFGHARIEYVASMIVSFAILLVGWELLTGSVRKILHPEPTAFRWLSVIVLGVSALVKLWMFFFNRSIARRIGSSVMRATAADSLSDAGATCAVLVCMLILRFTGVDVDAYAGVAVALLILWGGIGILRDTKNAILFLEDVGERPYRLDRNLTALALAGKFRDCAGIILGTFTDCEEPPHDNPSDSGVIADSTLTLQQIIEEVILPYKKPTLLNYRAGHMYPQSTLPMGAEISIDHAQKRILLP